VSPRWRWAHDYVTKPFSPREVVARARAVLRGAGSQAEAGGSERAAPRLATSPPPIRVDEATRRAHFAGAPPARSTTDTATFCGARSGDQGRHLPARQADHRNPPHVRRTSRRSSSSRVALGAATVAAAAVIGRATATPIEMLTHCPRQRGRTRQAYPARLGARSAVAHALESMRRELEGRPFVDTFAAVARAQEPGGRRYARAPRCSPTARSTARGSPALRQPHPRTAARVPT
jgi:hypothetical protein